MIATVTARQGGVRVVAANARAAAAGVRPGLSLATARAMAPRLRAVEADPVEDARVLDGLAQWCERYTPWVAPDPEAGSGRGLWLDVSGCARLFGGERTLLEDLVGRLKGMGLGAVAAVADTPGAAWAVARFGSPGGAGDGDAAGALCRDAVRVIAPGEQRRALAPLPVAGLRLPPALQEGLNRVGLCRIGDLVALPRAPLAARFGQTLSRRLDQALGRTGEPISPRRPAPELRCRLAFPEPVRRAEDVAAAARRLLDDLCRRLERLGQGARRLELSLFRVDGTLARARVGTGRAGRDADHLERLLREKLEALDAGFGVELMILAATATDPLAAAQGALVPAGRGRDGGGALARLVDRLANRLGPRRVTRVEARASHVPERASRPVPALAPPAGGGPGPARPRPLHLLPSPEPIEAMAPVPDHPPVMFRWRRRQYRVALADGPERIAPEWWREDPRVLSSADDRCRDYYRLEDAEGRRFWVFREGLYRPGLAPRWYLHGLFA